MLCNFHYTFFITIINFKCVPDCRKVLIFERYIDNRSHYLYNLSFITHIISYPSHYFFRFFFCIWSTSKVGIGFIVWLCLWLFTS